LRKWRVRAECFRQRPKFFFQSDRKHLPGTEHYSQQSGCNQFNIVNVSKKSWLCLSDEEQTKEGTAQINAGYKNLTEKREPEQL
jgi:hypothetical protein